MAGVPPSEYGITRNKGKAPPKDPLITMSSEERVVENIFSLSKYHTVIHGLFSEPTLIEGSYITQNHIRLILKWQWYCITNIFIIAMVF